jgi:hypothetical protein
VSQHIDRGVKLRITGPLRIHVAGRRRRRCISVGLAFPLASRIGEWERLPKSHPGGQKPEASISEIQN